MPVAFVNKSNGTVIPGTTSPQNLTPVAPTALTVGNVICAFGTMDTANGTNSEADITTATAGWTEHADIASQTTSPRLYVKMFWKIVDSTSMAMPTITFVSATTGTTGFTPNAYVLQFSGFVAFGASGANYAQTTAVTTAPQVPSPGVIAANDFAIAVAARTVAQTTITPPAGWTEQVELSSTQGADASAYIATLDGSGTNPGTFAPSATWTSGLACGRMWILSDTAAGGGGATYPQRSPVVVPSAAVIGASTR